MRVALIAGLLTVALGFARDAVYVEIAVSCMIWPSFCGPNTATLEYDHPRRPPARQLARVAPQQMVEGISELPTVLTSFDTLAEAQELLDESGPFAQLFVWPPFYVISVLGIIVGMPVATKLRLDSLGDAPTYRNGRY